MGYAYEKARVDGEDGGRVASENLHDTCAKTLILKARFFFLSNHFRGREVQG